MENKPDQKLERLARLGRLPSVRFCGKVFVGKQHHGDAYEKAIEYAKTELTKPGMPYEGLDDTQIEDRVPDEVEEGYGDDTTEAFVPRKEVQI